MLIFKILGLFERKQKKWAREYKRSRIGWKKISYLKCVFEVTVHLNVSWSWVWCKQDFQGGERSVSVNC